MTGRIDQVAGIGFAAARTQRVAQLRGNAGVAADVAELVTMSLRALPQMYVAGEHAFVQTVRRDPDNPVRLRQEGRNVRYAAIVSLGAGQLAESDQRTLLSGATSADLVESLLERGTSAPDLGAAALVGWASAEVRASAPEALFARIARDIKSAGMQPTVDYAWALTALLAARKFGDFDLLAEQAAERLLAAQGGGAIFPHRLPPQALGRYRAHVACYADQVYPIQALARYYEATGDQRAIRAANACAARIVELQGSAGQWWWHYDVRTGEVLEGFPVYSVHQHAMGPMALFDLHEAGGDDHRAAIALGLSWLRTHPESTAELLDSGTGAIWRKVGRREPRKAVRSVRSLTTAVSPSLRLGLLDRVFRPGPVDYECRPYEQGWLLYAWLSGTDTRTVDDQATEGSGQ